MGISISHQTILAVFLTTKKNIYHSLKIFKLMSMKIKRQVKLSQLCMK